MAHLKTRQQFRDSIRRKLGIVPPVDVPGSGAAEGAQPTNYPTPTNAQINDALTDALSDINRECQWHVLQFTVPVSAQPGSITGPFALDMEAFDPNTVGQIFFPNGLINDVQRVLWLPSGTGNLPQILAPTNRGALDRNQDSYYSQYPSVPQQWYIERYTLYVSPAQATAGTYILTCGTGVTGLACENDVIDQLPIDFQGVVEYQAIVRLSKTMTEDSEAMDRAQAFSQDAVLGMQQIKRWREGQSGPEQPTLGFMSYRTGYGTRRTVR